MPASAAAKPSAAYRPSTTGNPRSTAPIPHWNANDVENIPKLSAVITRPDIATGKCGVITANTSAPDMTVKP